MVFQGLLNLKWNAGLGEEASCCNSIITIITIIM
jgi:hypothetical protein